MKQTWVLIIFSVFFLSACEKKEVNSAGESSTLAGNENRAPAATQSTLDPIVSPDRDQAASASATSPSSMENASQGVEKSEKMGNHPPTGTNQGTTNPGSGSNRVTEGSQTEELALAAKSGCMVCHQMDKKLVGPAWSDVSKRYKGDAGAKARLVAKVKAGGKGNWTDVTGGAAMPPNSPKVSDENIEKLVKFILSLN